MRNTKVVKLGVTGVFGRMGGRILDLAAKDSGFKLVLALERPGHPRLGEKISGLGVVASMDSMKDIDCLIDFSHPEATLEHIESALKFKTAMVIGTTGFSEEQKKVVVNASKNIPVVVSPNMSIGVNLLFSLIRHTAGHIGKDYKARITEAHHVHKKDAPSGTAKFMAQIIQSQAPAGTEVDIKSIREGEIIGDHEIVFDSPWDTIRLSHRAKTRDIFALGALEAAKFVARKDKGLYDISDVLKEL